MDKLPIDIDLVVGIPRSGLLVAAIIALYRNIPFTDIDALLTERIYNTGATRKSDKWIHSLGEAKHILIVDDSITKGSAMKKAMEKINTMDIHCKKTFCAVYALPTNFFLVDIFFKICNQPRLFEWNYLHHWNLKYACVDIDGVLCSDPNYLQKIDVQKYELFLDNAIPKIIPTKPIGYLVTSRLEKYRDVTELWLKKHGVIYDNLIMRDTSVASSSQKPFNHGEYKGKSYLNTDSFIFIESSYEEAVDICKISKKLVYCTENNLLIKPEEIGAHISILINDWRITLKEILRRIYAHLKRKAD